MASEESFLSIDSYDTALCIIPPKHLWPPVDQLRSVYDPAYKKWPPHINLVYPFVSVHDLPRASELIVSRFQEIGGVAELNVRLDTASGFINKKVTFFIQDRDPSRSLELTNLRSTILDSLQPGHHPDARQMHMTVGQSKELNSPLSKYIMEKKIGLLPPLEWTVDKLYVLVRDKDKTQIDEGISSQMKIWGEINLTSLTLLKTPNPTSFYEDERTNDPADAELGVISGYRPLSRPPYTFSQAEHKWIPQRISLDTEPLESAPGTLAISSYNVQAEFQCPPTRARYPIIIQNLLERSALADVLVLQEVTDDFLSHLCKDKTIRENYPFFSNGPPDQIDIEPLPYHTNVVVLSKWPFSWDLLAFPSSRRSSAIVQFSNIGIQEEGVFLPIILFAVHLTSGLTNNSIEKKQQELLSILKYIPNTHLWNPWILAGDFNITTSVYTIETAVKRKEISSSSEATLSKLEAMFTQAGLVDSWTSACIQYGDSVELDRSQHDAKALGGERGATFDPTVNDLAANAVCSDFHKRPQRYDRILVRGKDFTVVGFNMFGQRMGPLEANVNTDTNSDGSDEQVSYGSDHWGIRCLVKISRDMLAELLDIPVIIPENLDPASSPLSHIGELAACLSTQPEFPSEVDIALRETALNLLKEVILQGDDSSTRGLPAFVIVPVGTYGLGVWTTTSDIDCLCIGPISSKTFFALAVQRLRKAASRGIKILRRVDAHFGTVLELEVGHIKVDLQYCSAVSIAETWPNALTLPPTDPIFKLSPSVLAQLKPMRDLYYLLRTVPDLAAFKLAYLLIKCWAKRRGIYAAKFGYLGGIQIAILLSRVCKLLSQDGRPVNAPTILATFYSHYAIFNWEEDMVFDPFFHKELRYFRTAQEPMAVLGFYGPSLNTTQTATIATVHAISKEFRRANELLSRREMTWTQFLGEDTDSVEFLDAYKMYIKITAQFWGTSFAKGNIFVDWLESRCIPLLVDLSKQVPHVNPRIWPARFVRQDAAEEDTEYEGHYIVGLEMRNAQGQPLTKEETRAGLERVQATLRKFETQVRSDSKYFDPKSCWMGATVVPKPKLGELRLDDRDWAKYTVEAEDADIGDSEFWASVETEEPGESRTRRESPARLPSKPAYEGKFRSASDVLNRLRWDQAMDSSDYIVGYEDRFSGVMERSVDSWKSETTHEEFIPEHRIVYFKRKSDGAIVWDKEQRRDEIFGSGVTSLIRQPRG
ncbi:hypothetical protein F5Y13DRAFT_183709 [Hypoxylon sp. FL1857]|nr:hypothetical protein F5Y13DRAFT_183709 [Hypoxylon sp. FL1857]